MGRRAPPLGSVRSILLSIRKSGSASSQLLGCVLLGPGMEASFITASLSMVCTVALYAPWCHHLESLKGIAPSCLLRTRNAILVTRNHFLHCIFTLTWFGRRLLRVNALYLVVQECPQTCDCLAECCSWLLLAVAGLSHWIG